LIRTIVLDSSPLSLLCHPNPNPHAIDCQNWATSLQLAGHRIIVAEIADYEVRRELIRARRDRAIRLLDGLHRQFEYRPLSTSQLLHAAEMWAHVRQLGLPTAGSDSLDADVILAAQSLSLNDPNVVVATSNPAHLSRFVSADLWQNIPAT